MCTRPLKFKIEWNLPAYPISSSWSSTLSSPGESKWQRGLVKSAYSPYLGIYKRRRNKEKLTSGK